MNHHTQIIKELKKYNDPLMVLEIMKKRQSRLKILVIRHGIEYVALAGGYTVSTLAQYMRVSNPASIGLENLKQAEHILNNLK